MENQDFLKKQAEEKYEFYKDKEVRENIYKLSKELATYLHDEKIPNIILLDRSPRPAWVGVDEYWKLNYKGEKRPNIYFVNPDGFNSVSKVINENNISREDILRDKLIFSSRGESAISKRSKEVGEEIKKQFEQAYFALRKDKSKPLAVFDNCIHTGETMLPVLHYLKRVGYEDLRVVAADTQYDFSSIKVDKSFAKEMRYISCNIFGSDSSGVVKGDDVFSRDDVQSNREKIIQSRQEIRRIIQEKEQK